MTGLDFTSVLLGIALYPAARLYYRTFIGGINSLRDYRNDRAERTEKPVQNFSSIVRLPRGSISNSKIIEDEHGLKSLHPWSEGEYATEA